MTNNRIASVVDTVGRQMKCGWVWGDLWRSFPGLLWNELMSRQ